MIYRARLALNYINVLLIWFILQHDDVIKWKHFPRNWPFVRKIHRSPVNFPHKGQWRGALMFSLIYVWINDWANNREAGDLRRYPVHYDVIVMNKQPPCWWFYPISSKNNVIDPIEISKSIAGIPQIIIITCNHIYYKVWDEITYPFLNFNGSTVGAGMDK